MSTKNNPGKFDCYANAAPDEEMFILLARDITAPKLVRDWALRRQDMIEIGEKPVSDQAMVDEALECAAKMETWRKVNRP